LPFKCTPPKTIPVPTGTKLSAADCDPDSLTSDRYWWSKWFRKCLGAMSHVQNWTFPEIALAISMLSQFMSSPGQAHWDFLFISCHVVRMR
jgi:hypothetical protein